MATLTQRALTTVIFWYFLILEHACLYKIIMIKCVSLLKIVSSHVNRHLSCGNACAGEFAMTFECRTTWHIWHILESALSTVCFA